MFAGVSPYDGMLTATSFRILTLREPPMVLMKPTRACGDRSYRVPKPSPSPVVSTRLGSVEEPNGVQSWPTSTNHENVSLTVRSSRAQASRTENMLDRMVEMFRFIEREKLPSKSASNRPVS